MSRVDELKDRLIQMIADGCTRFGWTVGPSWHDMTIEEKAATILKAWDAPREVSYAAGRRCYPECDRDECADGCAFPDA